MPRKQDDNPMIQPIYIIYESPLWPGCGDSYPVSRIMDKSEEAPKDAVYKKTEPMSLVDIEYYISAETSKLLSTIKQVKQCDTAGLSLNTNTNNPIPGLCSSTFKNFSQDQIADVKKKIIANTGKYVSEIDESPFNNVGYTDEYVQSKMTENDKKPLCQRYADVLQMLTDFSDILKAMNNLAVTNKYLDHYHEIMKTFQQNNNTRQGLEKKLESVYGENSVYDDSRKFLDSTIYVGVLWTVLATTALFYIFKKM